MSCAKHSSLSVSVSPLSPHPPHPGRPLIRLLAVILLVGVTIVPILVFLGEVGLGAQRRQREEAGAGADRGQRRRLQPHGQWGQRQGQSLQLGQLMGLELLLQGRQEEVVSCLGPPTSPRPPPASLPTCPPAPPPARWPASPPDTQTYSDDGVQLRGGDLLGPLDGSQDLLLVLEGGGYREGRVLYALTSVARHPLPLLSTPPENPSLQLLLFTKPQSLPLENGNKWCFIEDPKGLVPDT